jgi:3-methyladenine DNA glycosylase/8-oxoguanine DNA glycosylase
VVTSQQPRDLGPGLAWLREADPVLARVIDDQPAFDPNAWMRRLPALDLFGALVFQVIGQQISVVAATAIFGRLVQRFGGRAPGPEGLAALDPEALRELGLSRQKANTVLDLAQRFTDRRLSEAALRNLSDEEAIRQLTAVKGVGPWTAKGSPSRCSDRISSAPMTSLYATRSRFSTVLIIGRTPMKSPLSRTAGVHTAA